MDHGMPSAGVQLENNDERGIFKVGPHITIYVTPTQYPPNPSQTGFSPYNYGGNPQGPSVSSYPYSPPGMQNADCYPPPEPAESHPTVVVVSQPDPADLAPMQNADYYPSPGSAASRSTVTSVSSTNSSISSIDQQNPAHLVSIRETYSEHMASACIIFWFCGFVFGAIAFILAVMANEKAADGKNRKARELGQVSEILIWTGLIVGLICWTSIGIWVVVEMYA